MAAVWITAEAEAQAASSTGRRCPSTRPAALPALTGIRFLAAVHVVLYHYGAQVSAAMPWWAREMIGAGHMAVGLFYVLSGFVLAYAFGTATRRQFWVARIARIYPVYLLALLLSLPFFWEGALKRGVPVLEGIGTSAAAALALQAWVPQWAFSVNTPGWSISCEAFFYLAFPIAWPAALRLRSAQLRGAIAALWAVSVGAAAALWLATGDGSQIALRILYTFPLMRLPEFLIGICAGVLFLRVPPGERRPARAAALALAGTVGALATALLSRMLPFALVRTGMLAPLFAAGIYGLALRPRAFETLLGNKAMVLLGNASYAVYILQAPLYAWLWRPARKMLQLSEPPPLFTVAYLMALVAGSVLVYKYLERPMRERVKRALA